MSNAFINQSKVEQSFSAFLKTIGVSEKTRINYLSDIRNFLDWLAGIIGSTANSMEISAALGNVTAQTLETYKNSQIQSQTPATSINRRLSSVRTFFRFANESALIPSNPTNDMKNITDPSVRPEISVEAILGQFEASLRDEGAAETTTKNYVNDVQQFLLWINRTIPV
jgi:site-specific recombinase XerD